ncbi:MAG: HPr kinase/phosphorylase [Betaproteobacteria bacterium RIFCSPLOWO2_02_FULL_67_26]|nr:MAG: HPr kinase/phosphorylase [Betaproteobacteria bacterium RIFCSPLOWO2_02_FULL_67_26]
MPRVSIARLFEDNREKLGLEWVAGRNGGAKELNSELTRDSAQGLIGHLNFIHPNLIQVLGASEVGYLANLDTASCHKVLAQITTKELACFVVAGVERAPASLAAVADATHTPLFRSPVPSVELMWMLRPYLARALAESTTSHGVLLDVLGMGVLITGDSGVGKSELALELISRGSGLIADDVVELYRIGPDTVEGRCPALLKDFLEVRGLGVLNIRTIFGEAALRPRKNVKLIVHLARPTAESAPLERLPLHAGSESIMGVDIRRVTIPVAAGRNLAVLTEAAVRNYVLQLRGFDSTQEFVARQSESMKKRES